ncbi:ArdC family protein [Caviibacterium pharyngocola]|uniref:Antirestriction protein n=1 Tax=Caviibacterium pharyngocola TaxID=28159 RepID=A0A2M8RV78_9PAST|nr:zincin-like metallopeptidase domain-containing protein [Caviibacterium pharyngocola]PJG82796.1 antirestriction protein [Caviibacterium pharyngocola]
MKSSTQSDLYQKVTDKILVVLETGTKPWQCPWDNANVNVSSFQLPCNGESGRLYSGVNIMLLWMAQIENGFTQRKWVTFKGARNLGGSVRSGEKATEIILYRPMETEEKDDDGNIVYDENGEPKMKRFAVIRGFYVFNIEQCEGLDEHYEHIEPASEELKFALRPELNALPLKMGVIVQHRPQNQAYYQPSSDVIVMPEQTQFDSAEQYYGVLLHETAHATGHRTRLNRVGITNSDKFSGEKYAFEELIAELTSAFTCAHLGICNTYDQNAAYLDSWIKCLKSDKHAIFRATAAAREATDYLMDIFENEELDLAEAN